MKARFWLASAGASFKFKISSNFQELEATYEELVATEEQLRIQFEELQQSKARLKQSEERYKLALLGSHDGIWDWDIVNNSYYYSEKWANMLGYTKKSLPLVNRSWKEFIHPMDLELFEKVVKDYISKNQIAINANIELSVRITPIYGFPM